MAAIITHNRVADNAFSVITTPRCTVAGHQPVCEPPEPRTESSALGSGDARGKNTNQRVSERNKTYQAIGAAINPDYE